MHIAVDTLGHLLALTVTPADQGDRTQVEALAQQMQRVTGDTVELAYVDRAYVELVNIAALTTRWNTTSPIAWSRPNWTRTQFQNGTTNVQNHLQLGTGIVCRF